MSRFWVISETTWVYSQEIMWFIFKVPKYSSWSLHTFAFILKAFWTTFIFPECTQIQCTSSPLVLLIQTLCRCNEVFVTLFYVRQGLACQNVPAPAAPRQIAGQLAQQLFPIKLTVRTIFVSLDAHVLYTFFIVLLFPSPQCCRNWRTCNGFHLSRRSRGTVFHPLNGCGHRAKWLRETFQCRLLPTQHMQGGRFTLS